MADPSKPLSKLALNAAASEWKPSWARAPEASSPSPAAPSVAAAVFVPPPPLPAPAPAPAVAPAPVPAPAPAPAAPAVVEPVVSEPAPAAAAEAIPAPAAAVVPSPVDEAAATTATEAVDEELPEDVEGMCLFCCCFTRIGWMRHFLSTVIGGLSPTRCAFIICSQMKARRNQALCWKLVIRVST